MEYKDVNPRRESAKGGKKSRKNKKRSRLRKGFVVFLVFFIIAAVLSALSITVFFKIETLSVSGNLVYESEEILTQSGIKKGSNMFLLFDSQVESRLRQKLPFIESVKLKRLLPDKLEIAVTEAEEYYCYPYAGQFFTASRDNRVLAKYSSAPTGLVLMNVNNVSNVEIGKTVTFTDAEESGYIEKLFAALEKNKITVSAVDFTDLLSIKVTVSQNITVNFGGPTDLEGKTAHLAAMLKKIDENEKGTINLSVWSETKDEGYFIKDNLQ